VVIEDEPLGTGGAIKFACMHSQEKNIVVVNGDSIFKTDLSQQVVFHERHDADCTTGAETHAAF
jgi:D-glycero-alpha-D-manno-heptose 1-phosphate guanylyltransferase